MRPLGIAIRFIFAGCCARAASGHVVAAQPKSVMNSRRCMYPPSRRWRSTIVPIKAATLEVLSEADGDWVHFNIAVFPCQANEEVARLLVLRGQGRGNGRSL